MLFPWSQLVNDSGILESLVDVHSLSIWLAALLPPWLQPSCQLMLVSLNVQDPLQLEQHCVCSSASTRSTGDQTSPAPEISSNCSGNLTFQCVQVLVADLPCMKFNINLTWLATIACIVRRTWLLAVDELGNSGTYVCVQQHMCRTSKYFIKFDFALPSKSKLPLVTSWSDSADTFMFLIAQMGGGESSHYLLYPGIGWQQLVRSFFFFLYFPSWTGLVSFTLK